MTPTDQANDSLLLTQVAAGDERAFMWLYREHGPSVVRLAWAVAPSRDAVQELVQDTFMTMWQKAGTISLIGPSALPWLLVTCRNHARNRARKDARWASNIVLNEDLPDPTSQFSIELRWVHEAIAALPELDRRICDLCLIQGHSYESAGRALGLTPSAVGKRIQRARTVLRRELR